MHDRTYHIVGYRAVAVMRRENFIWPLAASTRKFPAARIKRILWSSIVSPRYDGGAEANAPEEGQENP